MTGKLSRSEHLNIMTTPEVDAALRAMALNEDVTITVIVRRALEKAFKNDPVFQAITAYVKALSKDEYSEVKLEMQNTSLPPKDRIPSEIKNILEEFGNAS